MKPLNAAYIVVESAIALSAVLSNTLVIWAVKHNPGLRNVTSYFILSLALADMAVGLIVIPLAIVVSIGINTPFYGCLFMCCVLILFTNASILSLLVIAIDRYLRIKIPTRYKTVTTQRNIWLSLVACWLASFIMGLVPMFGWNKKAMPQEETNSSFPAQCNFTDVMRMDYMVYFSFFGSVLLPLLLMSALYLKIFYLIRKQLHQNMPNSRSIFYGREYKTAKSLALVLILYALCWLPISLLNCVYYFWPSRAQSEIFTEAVYFSILLSHAHSAMNPLVYALKIKKFKETYKDIVYRYILRRSGEPISSSDENTMEQLSQAYPVDVLQATCVQDCRGVMPLDFVPEKGGAN